MRTAAAIVIAFCLAAGRSPAADAAPESAVDPAARADCVAELRRQSESLDWRIRQLEEQAEYEDSFIPYTNVRMSPTLMEWRDLFRRKRGACAPSR